MAWVSLHIFYSTHINLLLEEMYPLVQDCLEKKIATQFFFIRYSEKGPHIRLRLNTVDGKQQQLNDFLLCSINTFLERKPSPPLKREPGHYENNSVQIIGYEPELTRYGGKAGLSLSERFFMVSSLAVLRLIISSQVNSYKDSLIHALKMQVALAYHCCNGDIDRTIGFQEYIFKTFSGYFYYTNPDISADEITRLHSDKYLDQEHIIDKLVHVFWDDLATATASDEIYEAWNRELEYTCRQFEDLANRRLLIYPELVPGNQLWTIYQSHIHMSNNRLGINNADEALLAFFIMESLKKWKKQEISF